MIRGVKSQVGVISLILLVLISLISVTIVWNVIALFLSNSSSDIGVSSFSDSFEISSNLVKYGPVEQASDTIVVGIKKNSGDGKVDGFKIVLENEKGDSYVYEDNTSIAVLETNYIPINYKGFLDRVSTISIYPRYGKSFGGAITGSGSSAVETKLSKNYYETSLINASSWVVGTSGTQPGFTPNGPATKNRIITGLGPRGYNATLWEALNTDAVANDDGGWDTVYSTVDTRKTYRFSVWIKKTNSNDGNTYFGLNNASIKHLDNTNPAIYPYFFLGDLPTLDTWYLLVGYVYAYDLSQTPSLGGVYNERGEKVISFHGITNGDSDYKFTSASDPQLIHRAYLYYDTTIGDRQYFFNPRIEVIDGSELSIDELLGLK